MRQDPTAQDYKRRDELLLQIDLLQMEKNQLLEERRKFFDDEGFLKVEGSRMIADVRRAIRAWLEANPKLKLIEELKRLDKVQITRVADNRAARKNPTA